MVVVGAVGAAAAVAAVAAVAVVMCEFCRDLEPEASQFVCSTHKWAPFQERPRPPPKGWRGGAGRGIYSILLLPAQPLTVWERNSG